MPSDVSQFRDGPAGADDAEGGQHQIPADERDPKLITRTIGHPLLTGENDKHVDTDVVEAASPVAIKPNLGIRVLKFIFKFEDVRVIGHRHHHWIHPGCRRVYCAAAAIHYFQHIFTFLEYTR